MYNIRSFIPKFGYLEEIQDWVKHLKLDTEIILKWELLLILNEAFANSSNASSSEKSQITIVIREEIITQKFLDIVVTDTGQGIKINGISGSFPPDWIGSEYLLVNQDGISVYAVIESENCASFYLKPNSFENKEILEGGRGLISIIKLASQVKYYYSKSSFNYLFVRVQN